MSKPLVNHDAGIIGRVAYRILQPILYGLCRVLFRLEILGGDNLPSSGAYVIAPIHRSGIDFLIAAMITRRRVRWMAKSDLWKRPALGNAVQAFGAFSVNRGAPDRSAMRMATAALRDQQPVIVFPEGTRHNGPEVAHLYDGAAWLACRERVPLVPVGIAGAEAVMPRGAKFIRPSKIVVVIGTPIWPDVAPSGRVPRSKVHQVTQALGQGLQRAYDDASERRADPELRAAA